MRFDRLALVVNLKKLSEKLGLSQTTVSRALNGYPEVKEGTRDRVLAAAEKYNYRANTRAKSLATGRAMAIGHVIPSSSHEMINPIFADFIAGAGETYSEAGYDMILSIVKDQDEERTYREIANKKSVDGVIVHGPRIPDSRIKLLNDLKLPFLMHGRSDVTDDHYPWLDMNNRSAFRRATEFLLDLGHTRIALLNGKETMNFAARRRTGFEEALNARGIPLDPALMRSDEMLEPYGYTSVMEMMKLANPPTAFLVSSVISAIGAQRAVQELGLELGKDISLITHDDQLSFLQISGNVPMFTCTRSSVRLAGKRCAEMLLAIIENPDSAPRHELWEAQLTVGNSTGRAKS